MSGKFASWLLTVALLSCAPVSGQVVFSRRIYQVRGSSYQQIWVWNPADGSIVPLTRSARDHYQPRCSSAEITFTSPSPDSARPMKLWTFDRKSGMERMLGAVPEPAEAPAAKGCEHSARQGPLEACANAESLVITRDRKPAGKFEIATDTCPIDQQGTLGRCHTPIQSLAFTADGKWLLVGEEGLNDNSTSRQQDYSVVNLTTMKLVKAGSGLGAFWLSKTNHVLYVTPRELMPLGGGAHTHSVWVQQLLTFDPFAGRTTQITSGLSNNVDPSPCR